MRGDPPRAADAPGVSCWVGPPKAPAPSLPRDDRAQIRYRLPRKSSDAAAGAVDQVSIEKESEMTDVDNLLNLIGNTADCRLLAPSGLPTIEREHFFPDDLARFYALCGGAIIYESSAYCAAISPPKDLVLANPVIAGERGEHDISSSWYIVAYLPDLNYITIDLSNNRLGRCYDSSLGCHANPGYCPVIAKSFLDLLANLHREGGTYWYWLEDDFAPLGDAYDVG